MEPVSAVVFDDSTLLDELIEGVAQPLCVTTRVREDDADIRLRVAPIVSDDPNDGLFERLLRRRRTGSLILVVRTERAKNERVGNQWLAGTLLGYYIIVTNKRSGETRGAQVTTHGRAN